MHIWKKDYSIYRLCGCEDWLIGLFSASLHPAKLRAAPDSNTHMCWCTWGDCESALWRKSWQIPTTEQTRDGNRLTGWYIAEMALNKETFALVLIQPEVLRYSTQIFNRSACDSSEAADWCGCCVEEVKRRAEERKLSDDLNRFFCGLTSWRTIACADSWSAAVSNQLLGLCVPILHYIPGTNLWMSVDSSAFWLPTFLKKIIFCVLRKSYTFEMTYKQVIKKYLLLDNLREWKILAFIKHNSTLENKDA